jgi:hypothetical protein
MLVIRTSDGENRPMDLIASLKRESAGGKTVKQVIFAVNKCQARAWSSRCQSIS